MHRYCRTHYADATLIVHARSSLTAERIATADLLADLAEIDDRKLYARAAYSSMAGWCMGELHMEEQEAYKYLRAARVAREIPELFEAVADGRLHLTAVILLKPHLKKENAEELIAAARWRTQEEIRELLVRRFSPVPASAPAPASEEEIEGSAGSNVGVSGEIQVSAQTVTSHSGEAPPLELTPPAPAPGPVVGRARLTPLSDDVYDLQVNIRRGTRDLLRRTQDLLGRQVPPGDMDALLAQVLQEFVRRREARKFGRTDRPRRSSGAKKDGRYIPAGVRRAVAEHDQGRCTYVSETGKRCDATYGLEYDHIVPIGRGGTSTADNLRLRCRTHNQFEAEQTYGAGFMKNKREQAKRAAATGGKEPTKPERGPAIDPELDVRPWLRSLGIRPKDAERAAEHCATLTNATLEERVKAALSFLVPPHRRPVTSHLSAVTPRAEDASAA